MKHTLDRIISCAILKRKKKGKEASNRFNFQLHYENTDKTIDEHLVWLFKVALWYIIIIIIRGEGMHLIWIETKEKIYINMLEKYKNKYINRKWVQFQGIEQKLYTCMYFYIFFLKIHYYIYIILKSVQISSK